jgi:hypothetical protein
MSISKPQNQSRSNSKGLFHALEAQSIACILIRTFVFTRFLYFKIWKSLVLKWGIANGVGRCKQKFF